MERVKPYDVFQNIRKLLLITQSLYSVWFLSVVCGKELKDASCSDDSINTNCFLKMYFFNCLQNPLLSERMPI